MPRLRIGLCLESLRLPVRQALRKAASLGVEGVQFNAVGELSPENLSVTGRREFLHLIRSLGMSLTGIGFPTRHGFNTAEGLEARIAGVKRVLSLSYEVRVPIVVGAIGRIPEDVEHPVRRVLVEAMTEVGQHADRVGAVFAVETGPEPGASLRRFIDSLGVTGIRVNLDPASLLIKGYDPVQAVRDLRELIVHSHARDAVRETGGELGHEATPGDGNLDWNEYLGALEEVGYRGWLVIERQQASNPEREISRAVSFLRQF